MVHFQRAMSLGIAKQIRAIYVREFVTRSPDLWAASFTILTVLLQIIYPKPDFLAILKFLKIYGAEYPEGFSLLKSRCTDAKKSAVTSIF